MTTAHRDLASPEFWERSLARSLHRRALVPRARREQNRRKRMAAVVASATMAGPATPLAFAAAPRDLAAEVASETPSQRAIEVRDGGLPLMLGSQGALVAQVQKALGIPADGIFGPQTDSAVRRYQIPRRDAGRRDRRAGHLGDAVRGRAPWAARTCRRRSSSASSASCARPGSASTRRQAPAPRGCSAPMATSAAPAAPQDGGSRERRPGRGVAGRRADRAARGRRGPGALHAREHGCGSSTLSSPVNGTVTSEFGPRWGRNHDGLDIAAPTGTAIRAAACGTVTIAGTQSGYGNIVCITHSSQFSTCYAHMSRFAVSQGAQVQAGSGDRLRGLHRQLHRAAPALRDARERPGPGPAPVPERPRPRRQLALGGHGAGPAPRAGAPVPPPRASGGATAAGAESDAGSGATASADSLAAGSSPEAVAGVAPASRRPGRAGRRPRWPRRRWSRSAAAPVEPRPGRARPGGAGPGGAGPVDAGGARGPGAGGARRAGAGGARGPGAGRARRSGARRARRRSHRLRWRPLRSPRWRPSRSHPRRSRPRRSRPSPRPRRPRRWRPAPGREPAPAPAAPAARASRRQ